MKKRIEMCVRRRSIITDRYGALRRALRFNEMSHCLLELLMSLRGRGGASREKGVPVIDGIHCYRRDHYQAAQIRVEERKIEARAQM